MPATMKRLSKTAAALALACLFAAPALAQLAGGNRDTSQPIEIAADRLEVQQDANRAIFRGNVDATQGDLRLRADTLTVHYRNDGQAGAGTARAASPEAGSSITRIDAVGRVFISSPQETAQGERGVYDLDGETIVLEGREVVLTRGQNVLKGQRVTLNLATGQSVMDAPQQGGRVRGLFMPSGQQQKAPSAPAPATGR